MMQAQMQNALCRMNGRLDCRFAKLHTRLLSRNLWAGQRANQQSAGLTAGQTVNEEQTEAQA